MGDVLFGNHKNITEKPKLKAWVAVMRFAISVRLAWMGFSLLRVFLGLLFSFIFKFWPLEIGRL